MSDQHGNVVNETVCEFDFENHDDLAKIIDQASQNQVVPTPDVNTFCIGLKLFAEVVMTHREKPIFVAFWPHIGAFIRGIKTVLKGEP